MEHKMTQLRRSAVAIPSVPQDQILDSLKLNNREIRSKRSLLPFLPNNPNPNMRSLDHSNVITTVPNRADSFVCVVLKRLYDRGFLCRADSAADHSWGFLRHADELFWVVK
jgi:hypothetical protein